MSDSYQPASRRRRFAAAMFDLVILVIAAVVVLLLSGLLETAEAYRYENGVILRLLAAGSIAYLILNGYLLTTRAQTIGKLILGLVVVKTGTQLRAEPWRVLLRATMNTCLYSVVGGVLVYLALIDPLLIFLKQRRCLHDWIFQTDVALVSPEASTK